MIQGLQDQYGTSRQVDAIAKKSGSSVEKQLLEDCGHSPYKEQPELTLRYIADFIASLKT